MTTKEKVLEMLMKTSAECDGAGRELAVGAGAAGSVFVAGGSASGRGAVSGEKLAAECGVSRAAVWKAVNALREQGYQIEGTPNGGYVLSDSDVLSSDLFTGALNKNFPELKDCHTEVFKEIDSTNTYAKRLLAECGGLRAAGGELTQAGKRYHKAVIVAESQTAGRGRLGRTFVSPAKSGIYLSIIYAPEGGIQNPARLTAATAVAICRAVRKLYGIETQIKWINDIFYKGKKICGILAEGVTNFESGMIESAIVGIGINIKDNPEAFGSELSKVAGSLGDGSEGVSRCALAAEIAGQTLRIFEEDKDNHANIIEEYRKLSFLIGQTLTVHPLIGDDKSAYSAKAIDIDDNAGLIVELADGARRTLNSGEVTLHS
ncbi:MAG: biotin--[acetyl-CoA-carboxylase] ligase [Treponema sp.]|nr:biotin--[acetyl-CoA-carboxylase] ligase [Treponema sp.]